MRPPMASMGLRRDNGSEVLLVLPTMAQLSNELKGGSFETMRRRDDIRKKWSKMPNGLLESPRTIVAVMMTKYTNRPCSYFSCCVALRVGGFFSSAILLRGSRRRKYGPGFIDRGKQRTLAESRQELGSEVRRTCGC